MKFDITGHIKNHHKRHLKIHNKVPVHTDFLHMHKKKHKSGKSGHHKQHPAPTDPTNGA